jgi:glycosyltransferase involved in cell wall biosynthesis
MTATLSPPSDTSTRPRESPPRRYRVLLVASHPVQYASPVFREMARHPHLDITVAYCSLQGAQLAHDAEFGMNVQWDVPLLDGYQWTQIPNRSLRPSLGRFWGLFNLGLWDLVRGGFFDAVFLLTGYVYASFWIALLAAKSRRIPVFFGTDATTIEPMSGPRWKRHIKSVVLPRVYALADVAIAASAATKTYLQTLGVPPERIAILPLVVDNDWWLAQSAAVDRSAVRAHWGIPPGAPVVLFCAKLQPWKRPLDLVQAFARADVAGAYLVIAGGGPLRSQVEEEAARLGLTPRTRFLGFVNQSALPEIYSAADLFVLPSQYDACPAVVCESMLCGTPAVISDEIRGRLDLVLPGETGFIFPCRDVDALARILRSALAGPESLGRMRQAARLRMETCSPLQNVSNFVAALERLSLQRFAPVP